MICGDVIRNIRSGGHLLKVGKIVFILLHGFEYLLDGVADQQNEVSQQEWPKDVDFVQYLNRITYKTQDECKRSSLPDLQLAQRTQQRLVRRMLQGLLLLFLLPFLQLLYLLILFQERVQFFSIIGFFVEIDCDSSGGEVADEQLQQIEADDIGDDVIGESLNSLKVGEYDGDCDGPSDLEIEDQGVDEGVVESPYLADPFCNQHYPNYVYNYIRQYNITSINATFIQQNIKNANKIKHTNPTTIIIQLIIS